MLKYQNQITELPATTTITNNLEAEENLPNNGFHYAGFPSTGTTAVPNDLFDMLAPNLSEAELRVLLYIIRRTYGFHKQADAISLNQLMHGITNHAGKVLDYGTGLSKPAVLKGVKGLVEKNIIELDKGQKRDGRNDTNIYRLCLNNSNQAEFQNNSYSHAEYLENNQTLNQSESLYALPQIALQPEQGKVDLHEQSTRLTNMGKVSLPKTAKRVKQHDPQNNRVTKNTNQNTYNNNSVIVGALALHNQPVMNIQNLLKYELEQLGINSKTAQSFVESYSPQYIEQKIRLVQDWLAQTPNATQNPAGFLRRAIEEDYQPRTEFSKPSQTKRFAAAETYLQGGNSNPNIVNEDYYVETRVNNDYSSYGQPSLPPSFTIARSTNFTMQNQKYSQPSLPSHFWENIKQDVINRFGLSRLEVLLDGSHLQIDGYNSENKLQAILYVRGVWQQRTLRASDLQVIQIALAQNLGCSCCLEVAAEDEI